MSASNIVMLLVVNTPVSNPHRLIQTLLLESVRKLCRNQNFTNQSTLVNAGANPQLFAAAL